MDFQLMIRIIPSIGAFLFNILIYRINFLIIIVGVIIITFISMLKTSSIFSICVNFVWLFTKSRIMINGFVIYGSSECRNLFSTFKFWFLVPGSIVIIEFLLGFGRILCLFPRRIAAMGRVSELQMHNW